MAKKKKGKKTANAKLLPSGNSRVLKYMGRRPDGSRIYESFTSETPDEAEYMALEAKLTKKRKGKNANLTVGEAMDKYIQSKDAVLSPSTLTGYRRMRRNVLQYITDTRLGELTQEDVQVAVNADSKRLSPKSVRNAHGFLSSVLKAYYPSLPLATTLPQKEKIIYHIPEPEELIKIIQALRGTDIELPVLLALCLTMRKSEVRGAQTKKVVKGRLIIDRAIVDTDHGPAEKVTKTPESTRVEDIPPYILYLIDQLPPGQEYITDLTGAQIYKRFTKLLENNGLPHFNFHSLRHASASIMKMLNVPDKYAMARGGWKTDYTMKNVYQHTFTTEQKAINLRINNYYEGLMQHEMQHEDEDKEAKAL